MTQTRREYKQSDFDWVNWTESDIESIAKKAIDLKRKRYEEVKKIPDTDRNFENTVFAIESSDYDINDWVSCIVLHLNASPSKSIRETAHRVITDLQKELVDIEYDEDIYKAVKLVSEKNEKLDEVSKKLLEDLMISYRRSGFELPAEKRNEYKENIKKLSELGASFDKNINDWEDHILISEEETVGLPDKYKEGLEKTEEGKYKVTLQYPDLQPFIQYSEIAEKRKEIIEKNFKKGGEKNIELLKKMVEIRDKNAKLLGYKNHGAYQTEVRMAKDTKTVTDFIDDLLAKVKEKADEELEEMRNFKEEILNDREVNFYDVAYLGNRYKKEKLSVDREKIREYFPAEHVKRETLDVYQELLNVNFKLLPDYKLWEESAELYEVREKNGDLISYFALDLYPREGKYGHYAVFPTISGRANDFMETDYQTPFAVMLGNFPKPNDKTPSLLSHGEVETFFHEFGHIVHDVLTKARYGSQSGTSTARDFVEAPSQMLEHWVWDRDIAKRLSSHYESGEELPDEDLDRLIKIKKFGIGRFVVGQMVYAKLDFTLHTEDVSDPSRLYADLMNKYLDMKVPKDQIFPAGFGHLNGYDAGYYGYMWSLVYADDMFSRFKTEGILNKDTGKDYRNWILEKGSSIEEIDLIKGFLGRDPNKKAFLEEIGVE